MSNETPSYENVADMLKGIDVDDAFVHDVNAELAAEQLSAQLQRNRCAVGLSQQEVANRLGITQSAVSKIEHKDDDNLTLKEIGSHLAATGTSMHLCIGASQPMAEQIKHHAFEIRRLLDELAETAGEDSEIKQGVQDFWIEAVVNLSSLLSRSKAVPHDRLKEMFTARATSPTRKIMEDHRYSIAADLQKA